jgi:hypothetical protein
VLQSRGTPSGTELLLSSPSALLGGHQPCTHHQADEPGARELDLLTCAMDQALGWGVTRPIWDTIKTFLPAAEHEEVCWRRTCALRLHSAPQTQRAALCLSSSGLTFHQVARIVGRDLIRSNAEAHREAVALAELLEGAATANAAALERLAFFTTPQRKMVRSGADLPLPCLL